MEEKHTSHSTYKIGYHLVWVTKYRNAVLNERIALSVKRILAQTCDAYGWLMPEVEVMPDHVHCFVQAPPKYSPEEIVRTLKSISALGVFTEFPDLKGQKFWGSGLWSKGYYVGTVGDMSKDVVLKYIQNQKVK